MRQKAKVLRTKRLFLGMLAVHDSKCGEFQLRHDSNILDYLLKQEMTSNADSYDWDLHFTLSEECRLIDIKAPPKIELKTYPNDKGTNSVREFTVKVKAFTEEGALKTARIQAKRLTDILAVKSAKHLGYNLSGFNSIRISYE
jgi:hypothetical protein